MKPGLINSIFLLCLAGSIEFSCCNPHSTDTCKLVPCVKEGKNGYEVHGNCIVCQKHYFFNIAKEICGCQLCNSKSPMTNCDDNVHHDCQDLKDKCLDSTNPGTKSHDLTTTEQVSTTQVTVTFNTPTSLQVTEPPTKYVDIEFDEKYDHLLKVHEEMKFNFQACENKLGSKIEIHKNLLSNISQLTQQKNALEKKVDDLKTKYSICTKNEEIWKSIIFIIPFVVCLILIGYRVYKRRCNHLFNGFLPCKKKKIIYDEQREHMI